MQASNLYRDKGEIPRHARTLSELLDTSYIKRLVRIRICIVHKEEEEKEKTLPMEMKREKLLLHILPNFLFVEVPQLWESKLTLITTRMLVEDALFNKGY